VYSGDDWYVLTRPNQKMVITESSLEVNNASLLKKLTSKSLFTWQRSMVANVLATSGEEWTEIFSKYNSGTYND
jgi:Phospholipase B